MNDVAYVPNLRHPDAKSIGPSSTTKNGTGAPASTLGGPGATYIDNASGLFWWKDGNSVWHHN